MSKITNQDIVDLFNKQEVKYPPVVVDQTNCRISDIIRKNQAGEQVYGQKNLQFDYEYGSGMKPSYEVNPFSDMGFDLDDVIQLAQRAGQAVTDLQNRQGEIKANMDKSKNKEQEKIPAPAPAPAPVPGQVPGQVNKS